MIICRFGIIGAGSIANHFCKAVEMLPDAEVVAVASTSKERAEAFAQANHIPESYGSYEEMLRQADINIVYIATTHNFHMDNIRLCFAYGKHVLCEKAMVLNAADAREVFRMAKEKGLFCMEAMWTRFLPQYRKAKQWIEEGRIGKIQAATSVVGFKAQVGPEHRLVNPELAGGAMYDIGVYAIAPLAYLVGERIEDSIGVWRKYPATGVDERATVILRFASCDAMIQCMFTANPKEYTIINGSGGYIELPFSSGGHDAMLYDSRRNLVEHFHEEWPHGFVFELEEVIRCIREGRITSGIMPPEDTVSCAEVFDKVLRG